MTAGSIGALVGMKNTASGDTLVGLPRLRDHCLAGITAPEPVFTCSVEAEKSSDDVSDFVAPLLCLKRKRTIEL